MNETPPAKAKLSPWTIWVPVIIAALGIVVFYNYLIYRSRMDNADRPAVLGRLEKDIELTERSGKTVHMADLKGKVLVISWVFTRCPRGCAAVIAKLKQLHGEYGNNPNVHFVSFTLDAEDTPEMMQKFARGLSIADDANWWFVNGEKDAVRKFMTSQVQFRPVQDMPEKDRLSPDDKYIHDLRVALIDHLGHVRGLPDILNPDPEFAKFWDEKLRKDLRYLVAEQQKQPYTSTSAALVPEKPEEKPAPAPAPTPLQTTDEKETMTVTELPKLYTLFNAAALFHIIVGLVLIKASSRKMVALDGSSGSMTQRQIAEGLRKGHIVSMSIALLFSAAFLGCYLYYHYHAGHVKFAGTGITRPIYFTILFTHIPLAVLNLPMIIMTVVPALRNRLDKHKRMAKWSVPIWLYVSVTGIIVYLMCYVWYGPPIRG